ncbi:MAG: polyprenyl synthetase family protein [Gammaproteobacteria bacterium]
MTVDPTSSASTPPDNRDAPYDADIINEVLSACRSAVVHKIGDYLDARQRETGAYPALYDLLRDYPFRSGKMLRPAMCISAARACGGAGHAALTAATALEFYHNAFLIHDDIEDGSESRRGGDTLHRQVGVARAINAGDATNVMSVGLLLENLAVVGVAKALHILHEIEFMARQSAEGQAMELDWVAANAVHLSDQDYFEMCAKKTCWYSFITPMRIGLIIGWKNTRDSALGEALERITRLGLTLGIAFQVQDDLLNLKGEMADYGKEIGGDIYEGKRTLMLNHVLAHSHKSKTLQRILGIARPRKRPEHIQQILEEMQHCGSIDHGWQIARDYAQRAAELLMQLDFLPAASPSLPDEDWDCPYADRRFLEELVNYVIYRNL